jgi:phospholipid/cholesterol/gamma-HCH transport system substrate-binding protein
MPAEKTNYTVTEIKAGIMVLASIIVLAGFVAAIRGCGAGGVEMRRYSADFTSIDGLNLGAEVRFGGVKAGKVIDIGVHPDERSRIRVRFEVPANVPVNHGSVATIDQISLTTAMHLEISTGDGELPLHQDGDRIESINPATGAFGLPDLQGVVNRLEDVLDGLITLLGVERAEALAAATGDEMVDLAEVTASLNETLNAGASALESLDGTISENRHELGQIVDRLAALEDAATELLGNLNAAIDENRQPLNRTVVNLEELSETAARQIEELTASLAVTLQYLQEVSGNSSDLVEQHRPTLEQILVNLESTTRSLKRFSRALAEQPNALVRGAKPQGREDGGK